MLETKLKIDVTYYFVVIPPPLCHLCSSNSCWWILEESKNAASSNRSGSALFHYEATVSATVILSFSNLTFSTCAMALLLMNVSDYHLG